MAQFASKCSSSSLLKAFKEPIARTSHVAPSINTSGILLKKSHPQNYAAPPPREKSTPVTLTTLLPELQLEIFDRLDPVSSTCLGLTSKHFYVIHRRKHQSVKLDATSTPVTQSTEVDVDAELDIDGELEMDKFFRELESSSRSWDPPLWYLLRKWVGDETLYLHRSQKFMTKVSYINTVLAERGLDFNTWAERALAIRGLTVDEWMVICEKMPFGDWYNYAYKDVREAAGVSEIDDGWSSATYKAIWRDQSMLEIWAGVIGGRPDYTNSVLCP